MKKLGEGATPGPWFLDSRWPRCVMAKDGDAHIRRVAEVGYVKPPDFTLFTKAPLLIEARDLLEHAVLRIELANQEGDSILSAWLPATRALLAKLEDE